MPMPDIPINPPKAWFSPPETGIPTDRRITIEASGRAYGYIALRGQCHVGRAGCVQPPMESPTNWDLAHEGNAVTAEGEEIKVAVIAGGIGHAPIDMETAMVPAYYENMGTQLLRVRYGTDENGLWFAGALWPDADELSVAKLRASSLSGDWRWHVGVRSTDSGQDFMGACLVNIPGFPKNSDGGLGFRPGRPIGIAASGYANFDEDNGFFVVDQPITAGANNMCKAEGGTCGCEGSCGKENEAAPVDAALIEQMRAIVAQHDEITAAASAENDPIQQLTSKVDVLSEAVNFMAAQRIAEEIQSEI